MRRLPHAALLLLGLMPVHASGQTGFRSRCGAGVHADDGRGLVPLPQGSLFCPLVADPKAEQTFASYVRGDFSTLANAPAGTDTNIAAVGIAYDLGLVRFAGTTAGDGLQIDAFGAVFAQFNLDEPSFDLINADYLVGFPATFRLRGFSVRLRVYHQSSHLGDEFLLAGEPERINLSFESAEIILSQELGALRIYAGGESFFRRVPADLAGRLGHAGIEIRPASFGAGRLLAALDVKAVEEEDEWSLAWSARAGVEIARVHSAGNPARVLSLLAQYYDGAAPYGQFYRENIRFYGIGLHFSL
jgi:hypothetical protein